jgi:hypothetical protein
VTPEIKTFIDECVNKGIKPSDIITNIKLKFKQKFTYASISPYINGTLNLPVFILNSPFTIGSAPQPTT